MNARELRTLEAMFAAEVEGRLPYQTKSKLVRKLADEGYCEPMEITLPGRFPVVLTGWRLTLRGHTTYCYNCAADEKAEA